MRTLAALLLACSLAKGEPTVAVLPGESKPAATRLAEARKLADADKLPEAVELLVSLSDAGGKELVPLADGRSVRLRDAAQQAIARLPAAGLEAYRRRAEGQARKWLEDGDAARVADEASCARAALEAFDRLGDAAFLDARFDAAEQWWRRIAPLDQGGPSCPDPPEAVAARARAKQVLARLHAGRPDAGLEAFRKLHPKATGKLAGQEGLYADILAKASRPALEPLAGWPTFGGDLTRGRIAASPGKLPADLARLCRAGPTWKFSIEDRNRKLVDFEAPKKGPDAARRLAFHPVLAGTTALVADGRYVTAYDLKAGTAKEWFDLSAFIAGTRAPAPMADLRHTLTVADGHAYARLGTATVRDIQPRKEKLDDTESVLVCLALVPDRDGGRRRWMARASDPARKEHAVFEGSPLVAGGRAYIAATRFDDDRVVTALHCYAARSDEAAPAPLWRVDVCETRELRPGGDEGVGKTRARHHLLTLAGGLVVYCSHSGAIVAVDARTGQRAWAVRYPRREILDAADDPSLRDLAPCLMANGLLYAAPNDSDRVLCLDPLTGETKWQRDRLDVVHLLGVGKGRLIFTTWRNPSQGRLEAGALRAVNAFDGSDDGGWILPDDEGGLVPFGRGLLAGDLVLWPTFRKPYGVFAVRQEDGRQPDNPALLHRIPSGNLACSGGILLVADARVLYAFVPPDLLPDEVPPARKRLDAMMEAGEWASIAADPALSALAVRDGHGLPQSAGVLAAHMLGKKPKAVPSPGMEARGFHLSNPKEVRLAEGETLLAVGPAGMLTGIGTSLACRDRNDGKERWRTALPSAPRWAAWAGKVAVAAGKSGAIGIEAGKARWTWPAPGEPTAMRLIGERAAVIVDGGLFMLDAATGRCLWRRDAPGACLGLPAPAGRIHWLLPLAEGRLLAQASTRRWVLDAGTGAVLHQAPTRRAPWPRAPTPWKGGAAIVEGERIETIGADGRTRWTFAPPGKTTRTGEPPWLVPAGKALLCLVPENIGLRLYSLDAEGKPGAERPLLDAEGHEGWLADGALFHAGGGRLTAWSLPEGKERWRKPLAHPGPSNLAMADGTLLAWPARGRAARARFRWLLGSTEWKAGPWPGTGCVLGAFRPSTGERVGELACAPTRFPRTATALPRGGLFPSLALDRPEAGVPGPTLFRDGHGVVLALGDHVQQAP